MQHEPAIRHENLVQLIEIAYAIHVRSLSFMPVGFAAACYRVESAAGAYVLKLWLAPQSSAQRQRRQRSLQLTHALATRQIVPVAAPLLTRQGKLWAESAMGSYALFPWLDASPLPTVWPAALQDRWLQTMLSLHRATPHLDDIMLDREDCALSFLPGLRAALAWLDHQDTTVRSGVGAIHATMVQHRNAMQAQIQRLRMLQQQVRQLPSPFVVCHTDMGGDNLLLDASGELYVLDWDDACRAPPAFDLHEARWLDMDRLLWQYQQVSGERLYAEHFAFYILRRAFDDLTARLLRLRQSRSVDEDMQLLEGIVTWGIKAWEQLDTTLAPIIKVLES